jgi:hypothetical protein
MMNTEVVELAIQKEPWKVRIRQEGIYLHVDCDQEIKGGFKHKINIPLFHRIALFTSERRSYKSILWEFYDELRTENIPGFFITREALEKATQACGIPGGRVAFLLGLFCRYYKKLPRNVNVVHANCEKCKRTTGCSEYKKCDTHYGCGSGVRIPLDPSFNVEKIPEIRRGIDTEIFPLPECGLK